MSVWFFSALAFAFSAAAYYPYIRSIRRSKARPTLSAWISWFVMDTAILIASLAQGVVLYQVTAYVVGCLAIIGVALYHNPKLGWTRLDSLCMALVGASVALWARTGDPDVAIVLSLAAMTLGSVPMLVNTWKEPNREPILPWVLNLAGAICGALTIGVWTIAEALSPMVFLSLSIGFNLIIWRQLLPSRDKLVNQILMRD